MTHPRAARVLLVAGVSLVSFAPGVVATSAGADAALVPQATLFTVVLGQNNDGGWIYGSRGGSGIGEVTFALIVGSAPGCVLRPDRLGRTILYNVDGEGGCMVYAIKAGDATYQPATAIAFGFDWISVGWPLTAAAPARHRRRR